MGLIANLHFWLAAALMALALQLSPPIPRGRWLGLLNLAALLAVLGAGPTLVAGTASVLVWGLGQASLRRAADGCRIPRRGGYALAALAVLAALVLYKLLRERGPWFFTAAGEDCVGGLAAGLLSALSFSYAALRCLDYLRSVCDGEAPGDPLALCGYLFPFHMLTAGPIAAYRDFRTIDRRPPPPPTFGHVLDGANLIATGLVYKLVIAEGLRIFVSGVAHTPAPDTWWGGAYLLVYLFFDFAGYSLIALGIGRLCGIPTPINFDKPFLCVSVTEFWTRWHISLGGFVRANLYLPVQIALVRRYGTARSGAIAFLTTSASFTLVGLWHHLSPNFLVWGLSLGLAMAVEKVARDRLLAHPQGRAALAGPLAQVIGPLYVFIVVSASIDLVAQEVM